jgi:ferric-dicitrate binding protein FerR (iron transport regulator)
MGLDSESDIPKRPARGDEPPLIDGMLPADVYEAITAYVCGDMTGGEAAEFRRRMDAEPAIRRAVAVLDEAFTHGGIDTAVDFETRRAEMLRVIGAPTPTLATPGARPHRWRRLLSSRAWRATDDSLSWAERAGAAVLLLVLLGGAVRFIAPIFGPRNAAHFSASTDTRKLYELPNGARATLEPGSSLDYLTSETGPVRLAHLDGSALFEVGRGNGQPFEVHALGALARADDASFRVAANTEQQRVTFTVQQGHITVWPDSTRTGAPHMVSAGQVYVWLRGSQAAPEQRESGGTLK